MGDIAQEAKWLMNNEAFKHVVESARSDLIAKAMACSPRNDEGRRRYLDAAKTVDRLVSHLNALILASKTGEEVEPATYYEEEAKKRWAFLRQT